MTSILLLAGCQGGNAPPGNNAPPADQGKYLVTVEPAGAKGVLDVRKEAKDGDTVTVTGRVGGSKKPIIDGRAVFTIVDPSFVPCNERGSDSCTTPWDYCCDGKDELARGTASIKFADAQGKTLEQDVRALVGIKELRTVVVRGKARKDEAGNLMVLAEQIYVKK